MGLVRLRRTQLHLHEGRQEAALGTCGAEPRARVCPHAQPAHHRRRHGSAQVGLDERLHRGQQRPSEVRLDHRRPHHRHLPRAQDEAARRNRLHARGAIDQAQPYRHFWKPGDNYNDIYTGWSYPPKDYAKWGELVYQWVRHSVREIRPEGSGELVLGGVERAGHRLLARHAGRVHEAVRLCGRRPETCAADGENRRAACDRSSRRPHAVRSCGTSSNTACGAPTTPPARTAPRWTTSAFTPKERRG